MWYPSKTRCREWIARFHFLVQTEGTVESSSYLVSYSKLFLRANLRTIYHSWICRPTGTCLWAPSWDRLPMVLPIGSVHILVMTWTDIVFVHQATRQVDPIERPQILEFLLPVWMGSSIMEELKKYTNSAFMVPNLLIRSYSNVIVWSWSDETDIF
jgi:hypothetical protein